MFEGTKIVDPSEIVNSFKVYLSSLNEKEKEDLLFKGVINFKDFQWLSGHFYTDNEVSSYGPKKQLNDNGSIIQSKQKSTDIMIVGLYPGQDEIQNKKNFTGKSGSLFFEFIKNYDKDFVKKHSIYLTNLVKIYSSKLGTKVKYKKEDINLFGEFLIKEINYLKPKNIILMGDDVLKFLLGFKEKLSDYNGRFIIKNFYSFNSRIFAIANPVSVIYNPQTIHYYRKALFYILSTIDGKASSGEENSYTLIIDPQHLKAEVNKILDYAKENNVVVPLSFDMEWEGHRPDFTSQSKLISLQFYSEITGSVVFVLTNENERDWIEPIKNLLLSPFTQIIGHFFQADAQWLHYFGIDVRDKYTIPKNLEEIRTPEDLLYPGGFDIALAQHAIYEEDSLDLCNIAVKELGAKRWDKEIDIKKIVLNDHFYRYAAKDVFYTYKIYERLKTRLFNDEFGQNCISPFYISMKALPAFMSMMINGLRVDYLKLKSMKSTYEEELSKIEKELQFILRFPKLKVRSNDHIISCLYGEEYLYSRKGKAVKILPPGAICLKIKPMFFTDKGLPSSEKHNLLLYKNKYENFNDAESKLTTKVLTLFYNHKVISKALDIIKKVESFIGVDGKVKSFLVQTKESGRASSSSPNLQNIPKGVEEEYVKILGNKYPGGIRNIFIADPGETLISLDLAAAEILVGAVASLDEQMISDYYSSILYEEEDPRHVDIPSRLAIEAFNLSDVKPNKKSIKQKGYSHLRDAAKRLIYGFSYGGSVNTIYKSMLMSGVIISYEDIQKLMNSFSQRYYKRFFFNEVVEKRVKKLKWLSNCFGRKRRFYVINEKTEIDNDAIREALNFIPQSTVADSVSQILTKIHLNEELRKLKTKIILQVHDEIILSCRDEDVDVVKGIVKNLANEVEIYHADLNGKKILKDGFKYGIGIKDFKVWSD